MPSGPFRHEVFAAQAAATPDAVAIVFEGRRMTYRELDERSNRLARLLRRRRVGRDVPVGICLARSPDLVVGLLAILKAGGAFVPLEPTLPPAQLGVLLAEAAGRRSSSPTPGQRSESLATVGPQFASTERCGPSRGNPRPRFDVRVAAKDLAMIMFSSGSTGRPKAIPRDGMARIELGPLARSTSN